MSYRTRHVPEVVPAEELKPLSPLQAANHLLNPTRLYQSLREADIDELAEIFARAYDLGQAAWLTMAVCVGLAQQNSKYGDNTLNVLAERFALHRSRIARLGNVYRKIILPRIQERGKNAEFHLREQEWYNIACEVSPIVDREPLELLDEAEEKKALDVRYSTRVWRKELGVARGSTTTKAERLGVLLNELGNVEEDVWADFGTNAKERRAHLIENARDALEGFVAGADHSAAIDFAGTWLLVDRNSEILDHTQRGEGTELQSVQELLPESMDMSAIDATGLNLIQFYKDMESTKPAELVALRKFLAARGDDLLPSMFELCVPATTGQDASIQRIPTLVLPVSRSSAGLFAVCYLSQSDVNAWARLSKLFSTVLTRARDHAAVLAPAADEEIESFVLDEDGDIREISPALSRRLGYEREELLGVSGVHIMPARDDASAKLTTSSFLTLWTSQSSTEPLPKNLTVNTVLRDRDGAIHSGTANYEQLWESRKDRRRKPLFRGGYTVIRKWEPLDTSDGGPPSGVVISIDVNTGKVTYATNSLCQWFGVPIGAIIDMDHARLIDSPSGALIDDETELPAVLEVLLRRADGEKVQAEASVDLLRDSAGTPTVLLVRFL